MPWRMLETHLTQPSSLYFRCRFANRLLSSVDGDMKPRDFGDWRAASPKSLAAPFAHAGFSEFNSRVSIDDV
jgi:hypothetical protein